MSSARKSSYRGRGKRAANIDEYIDSAPPEARKHLRELRTLLRKAAPRAT